MKTPLLDLRAVHRDWVMEAETIHSLININLTILAAERVAVLGASGSGKSTLLNLVGLLDRPSAGQYLLEGLDTSRLTPKNRATLRNQKIGFIFQQFHLLNNLSAISNVALPIRYSTLNGNRANELAMHALEQVGLQARARHLPAQLSGGERQRVAIARAIAMSPSLLLADEPTGSLDTENGLQILELIETLHRSREMTVVMITHDVNIAKRFPRNIHMSDGRIVRDTEIELLSNG